MENNKQNIYKDLFTKIFKPPSDKKILISTVDHPYSSPPLRLFETYIRLSTLRDEYEVLPLIWDLSIPLNQTKRYDIYFDTGLLANHPGARVLEPEIPVYKQSPKLPNFKLIEEDLTALFDQLSQNVYLSRKVDPKEIMDNYNHVATAYKEAISKAKGNSTEFYIQLQTEFAKLTGIESVVVDHFSSSIPVARSKKLKQYIIEALTISEQTDLSPLKLGKKLFTKPFIHNAPPTLEIKSIPELIEMISKPDIFFSSELFFWGLATANINHFGNDYSFFERYEKVTKHDPMGLQLTEHNKDSYNLCEFEYDQAFIKSRGIFERMSALTKPTRINSFPALYVRLGKELTEIVQEYHNDNDSIKLRKYSYARQ